MDSGKVFGGMERPGGLQIEKIARFGRITAVIDTGQPVEAELEIIQNIVSHPPGFAQSPGSFIHLPERDAETGHFENNAVFIDSLTHGDQVAAHVPEPSNGIARTDPSLIFRQTVARMCMKTHGDGDS